MTDLRLLGGGRPWLFRPALASPVMAQQVIYNPGLLRAVLPERQIARNKGPGNPYNRRLSAPGPLIQNSANRLGQRQLETTTGTRQPGGDRRNSGPFWARGMSRARRRGRARSATGGRHRYGARSVAQRGPTPIYYDNPYGHRRGKAACGVQTRRGPVNRGPGTENWYPCPGQ